MPWLGTHVSIAGGLYKGLLTAQKHGCQSVQLFSKSPSQWDVAELAPEDVKRFRDTLRETRLRYPIIHDSYLINLASPEDALYRRSIEAFVIEMQRAEQLGMAYLVAHPGSYVDSDEDTGLTRIALALDEVHQRCAGYQVQILLETTAGQGTSLGHRFEHLAKIFSLVQHPERMGVCFDTCHVFAAGYALSPRKEYLATMRAFDRLLDVRRIRAFHLNDSRKPFGSRVDRHHHLGEGHLGLEPFRLIVNDRRFQSRPMILETPKEEIEGVHMDDVNLKILREMMQNK